MTLLGVKVTELKVNHRRRQKINLDSGVPSLKWHIDGFIIIATKAAVSFAGPILRGWNMIKHH